MIAARTAVVALLVALTGSPVSAQQTQTLSRIQNRFRPLTYLHTEQGSVMAGPIQPAWWSADWILEPVEGAAPNVRIRNRFRPTDYIHIERGRVESSSLGDRGWWSAQWTIEPVAGTPFSRIRNRWKPGEYLHTERGALESGPIDQGWWSAMWTVQNRMEQVAVAPPVMQEPVKPAPVVIPERVVMGGPIDLPADECPGTRVCGDMSDPTSWMRIVPSGQITAQQIPAGAYVAGYEPMPGGQRRNLYICVAYFNVQGQGFPERFVGKTGPGFTGCNVPLNGREIPSSRSFLILMDPLPGPLMNMAAATWALASGGVTPWRGIQTFGGPDVCRANHQGGLHPGRVIPGRGCGIGFGGNEVVVPAYFVLVRLGTARS